MWLNLQIVRRFLTDTSSFNWRPIGAEQSQQVWQAWRRLDLEFAVWLWVRL